MARVIGFFSVSAGLTASVAFVAIALFLCSIPSKLETFGASG